MQQTQVKALDLNKEFPRSPNESLAGYVLLPRIIDKCRAVIAGTNGEYKYNCPLDQRFFEYTGIDAESFMKQVEAGSNDDELEAWVKENAQKREEMDIFQWSYNERWRRPEGEMIGYFEQMRKDFAPQNYQIETWFQLLDADEKRF